MNETDRELLNLAAKAADVFLTPKTLARAFPKWKWDEDFDLRYENGQGISGAVLVYDYDGKLSGTTREVWNPLTDDGDALRLAVRCDLDIELQHDCVYANGFNVQNYQLFEWHKDDKCAATRRAIVRAAAEIGKNMP